MPQTLNSEKIKMITPVTPGTTLERALEIAGNVKEWKGTLSCDRDPRSVLRVINYEGVDFEGNEVCLTRLYLNGEFSDGKKYQKRYFALDVETRDIEKDGDGYYNEVSPAKQKGEEVAIRELFKRVDAVKINHEQTFASNNK